MKRKDTRHKTQDSRLRTQDQDSFPSALSLPSSILHLASCVLYLVSCVLILVFSGCGDESPFESQDTVPDFPPGSLLALNFPTAEGCSWTYFSADRDYAYTAKVAGTRNLSGVAARIMENRLELVLLFSIDLKFQSDLDEEIISLGLFQEFENNEFALSGNAEVSIEKKGGEWLIDDRVNKQKYLVKKDEDKLNIYGVLQDYSLTAPVDYFSSMIGFPIHNSFFTKDVDSYTEYAYELWLDVLDDTFFQRNSPKRILWSFPLYVGKEWTVSKSRSEPEITYTRKVVADKGVLTVPAGTFEDVYYVEEYVSIAGFMTGEEASSKYWIAPDVGVIKYEYVDPFFETTRTCELGDFKK
jgi:hypothetical protein